MIRVLATSIILLACVVGVLLAWREASAARQGANSARDRLVSLQSLADRHAMLSLSTADIAQSKRPHPDAYSLLARALADLALPGSTLAAVSPDADQIVASLPHGRQLRRQGLRVTLEPIALPDLGRFFARWREANPAWTLATINLSPSTRSPQNPTAASPPLRVDLTLESIYLDHPHSP